MNDSILQCLECEFRVKGCMLKPDGKCRFFRAPEKTYSFAAHCALGVILFAVTAIAFLLGCCL